ncbi:E3 SUMO-protein ligase PIAS2-like isoform X2 [Salvelinus fontinalis]|uniref:E3 SUMO-protein ligase PIAS2-like isoform X2 n=1 Tax=Salvelinus fontinalis TaxID=8038 RepID=UPI002485FC2C|nr:E3 SUMO-protein ligase PIAS2-like isoform X2 [Salvelinus fontinalis]
MAEFVELRSMVSSFRVSELQVLLGFAGRNKSGPKHELLLRVLHLLKNASCSPAVQIKIKELYRRRYPRTIDACLTDLAAVKPAFSAAAEGGGVTAVTSDLSDLSPDGAGVSRDFDLASDSLLLSGDSLVLHEETNKELRMNLQQPAPLIPPVHPDVQMKSLPFYDVLDILVKPSSLGASTVQRYHQEKYFIFALTPQQVREVCISRDFLPGGRRDYMVQIQLRFCLSETSCPQEDNYPNSLCIKVNGKLFPLPGYAPPPKNGVEQKRPGRPLNITSLVRLSSAVPNQISVTWAAEIGKTYSMSVYLVRQLTSPLLLQRLRMKGIRNPDHSRALIKEKLTADPDSEIATTSLRVSLMCPLGKMRLTVPCRAVTCSHLQCFDAALYLQMNEKKPTWVCPVCDKKAPYESLIIDGLVPLSNNTWVCPVCDKKAPYESLIIDGLVPHSNNTWVCPVCDKKAPYESLIIDGLVPLSNNTWVCPVCDKKAPYESLIVDGLVPLSNNNYNNTWVCPVCDKKAPYESLIVDGLVPLSNNNYNNTWVCPVCDKKAPYESLIIDGLVPFSNNTWVCPVCDKKAPYKSLIIDGLVPLSNNTWVCPVCDKKAPYESLIIDGLFMEILNDCSDVDEIKFQEDGTWCPMRPRKEALSVSSTCIPKIEPRLCAVVPSHSELSSTNKKADVIDLTLESSSSSSSEEEEEPDPPLKKRCLYMSKTEEVHAKGVLTYQPSTVRLPNVQALDTPYLMSSLADYTVPFHHSTLSTIPTDMQSLDLFSLIQGDSQHYRSPMFLDNLTSSLQGATTSAGLVSSSSQYETSSHHTTATSSSHETGVITGGGGGGSNIISDIISLD